MVFIKTTQFSAPRKTFITREVMGKYQKHGVVSGWLTEISERLELLSDKIPLTIRKNHEKTW